MNHAPKKNISGTEQSTGPITWHGMVEGQDARALAHIVAETEAGVVLHVATDEVRMQTLVHLLAFFAPHVRVLTLPGWDCLPYDRVSPSRDAVAARLSALARMVDWSGASPGGPTIILTTMAAAAQRVVSPVTLRRWCQTVRAGERLDQKDLEQVLVAQGYRRADTVREVSEFAVRGGIIDVFPSGASTPYRIDLFGDVVESIKTFDPFTQLSSELVKVFTLLPAGEYTLDEASIARFRAGYRDAFGVPKTDDVLYQGISEGRMINGAEHWLPLFHDNMATIFDYLPGGAVITQDPQTPQALSERTSQIKDYFEARVAFQNTRKLGDGAAYHALPLERLYLSPDEYHQSISTFMNIQFEVFQNPDQADFIFPPASKARDFSDIRSNKKADLFIAVRGYIADLKGIQQRVAIACYSEGSRDRLSKVLSESGMTNLVAAPDLAAVQKILPGAAAMIVLPLDHGFIAPDLAVITEQDILGDRLVRGRPKRRRAEAFIGDLSALHIGDLVVHQDHGIGRFDGLETVRAAGAAHDCLKLIYAGGDRLFLPVENMELITRFGGDGAAAELDKLGGVGWQARKARVKKNLMEMAETLLGIAAARATRPGDVFAPDTGAYSEFLSRFPYQETDDQQNAIDDVLGDLARGTPTDRLVCGDVGFGKTEVALRAAYVVAASGGQVAVVVPTTLLARQHTRNFAERFKGLGLPIGQLSRMVPAAERVRVKKGLADGSVRIVIGTHAVLAKDIHFANLGLLIVDEEQRFGVKQKEALKALKNDVHVLTLTATPIPRTLQMALTGVREMSIIATPPVDRLAIRTVVMPYDPLIVREAILRERHRGGQTFYVCPRVSDIADVAQKLRELVPEIRVVMAHGQLSPTDLEDRMSAFYDGQYDVLLATNIIESGIDIPTANTMIVHRADMFGLAQLYQIRGRIGRAKVRAHAYLTYDPQMKLNPTAQKRLEVIEMLDTLGAGFQLASHDLDIRGAGNLLGDDQSGHIREVGVELYQQMLEDAVADARARASADVVVPSTGVFTPAINIGTSVIIPETYVADLTVRLTLYRRLSLLQEAGEVQAVAAEMIDRFGPLPPEVQNLLDVIDLKALCRAAGVDRVDAGPQGAVIGFYQNVPKNPGAVMAWISAKKGTVKLRPDQKIVVPRVWPDVATRVHDVRAILGDLAGFGKSA